MEHATTNPLNRQQQMSPYRGMSANQQCSSLHMCVLEMRRCYMCAVLLIELSDSPLTPCTPGSPGGGYQMTSRRVLDQRRQLVIQLLDKHGYFPSSKFCVSVLLISI